MFGWPSALTSRSLWLNGVAGGGGSATTSPSGERGLMPCRRRAGISTSVSVADPPASRCSAALVRSACASAGPSPASTRRSSVAACRARRSGAFAASSAASSTTSGSRSLRARRSDCADQVIARPGLERDHGVSTRGRRAPSPASLHRGAKRSSSTCSSTGRSDDAATTSRHARATARRSRFASTGSRRSFREARSRPAGPHATWRPPTLRVALLRSRGRRVAAHSRGWPIRCCGRYPVARNATARMPMKRQ